ncbi:hypothetical protein [Sphingomonas sp. SUN039]|uniref:hypothetical protein n=1 Tax=Sphingomonas sp. SUN039 TaxID=2937787 RepID=UPI0021643EDB|nr:hypothetical protein [Sphingomonas sp. SUN039]UVO53052.1 hypothetical protein M0209_02555 [Sphingomonas sp. SUN039]
MDRSDARAHLAEWANLGVVPVHQLISFDFNAPALGIPAVSSLNLSHYVGQELIGLPQHESERQEIARCVARLAFDMLTNGPLETGLHRFPTHDGFIVLVEVERQRCRLSLIKEKVSLMTDLGSLH